MQWKHKWIKRMSAIKQRQQHMHERQRLYDEVMEARMEWELAHQAFQNAKELEEVDIAIYTLEAAERRYQMRLRAVKAVYPHWVNGDAQMNEKSLEDGVS
ncbi:DUF2508 family protein [Paenibacillus turicensis]|uniref:DUF2508 family protein n=1 Tax=Paenibacillus turicensis TaxID=160487 RepID=UPI003D2B0C1E